MNATPPPGGTPSRTPPARPLLGWFAVWAGALLVAALVLYYNPDAPRIRDWMLLLTAAVTFVVLLLSGEHATGRVYGLLIDDRNKVSLSRLQMVLWTSLVLGAVYVGSMANALWQSSGLSVVGIPPELYALMGLSTVSMVASPLVKSVRMSATAAVPPAAAGAGGGAALPTPPAQGPIVRNASPADASLADLVMGEEVGNWRSIDLAKTQMLLFTFVIAVVYVAELWRTFAGTAGVEALPALNETMVSLLGISHAGYLTHKAVPHTPAG